MGWVRWARPWHATIALVVLVALAIQIVIAVDAPATPPAHEVGTLRGTGLLGRVVRVLSFFTIQSNILCAVASARLTVRPDERGRWWRAVRLAGLFGITVTGVVYGTVLSEAHDPQGWDEVSTNFVFHYLTPAMTVAGWLLFGPRPRIRRDAMTIALCWPVVWSAWAIVHGELTEWYPYPFVDVVTHGYPVVLRNAGLVLCLLALVVALFHFGDRRLRPVP